VNIDFRLIRCECEAGHRVIFCGNCNEQSGVIKWGNLLDQVR